MSNTTVTFVPNNTKALVSINGSATTDVELTASPVKADGMLNDKSILDSITAKPPTILTGGSSRKFRKKVGKRRGKGKSKKHSSSRKSKY